MAPSARAVRLQVQTGRRETRDHVRLVIIEPRTAMRIALCAFACSTSVTGRLKPDDGQRGGKRTDGLVQTSSFSLRPEIRREYPLNLSISISGGKETN